MELTTAAQETAALKGVPWYVYLLQSSNDFGEGKGKGRVTYVGATTDPDRRLRQHNGELKGGARATSIQRAKGEVWSRLCFVGPFDKIRALQFEWRWKYLTRKMAGAGTFNPIERRWKALDALLKEDGNESLSVHFSA